MRYSTRQSVDKFNDLFGFESNPHSQDWHLEQCDAERLSEFVNAYSTACEDDDDRFTLMELILASYEDYVQIAGHSPTIWQPIRSLLLRDKALHHDTIDYWCLWEEEEQQDHDNWFVLTELMREFAIETIPRK